MQKQYNSVRHDVAVSFKTIKSSAALLILWSLVLLQNLLGYHYLILLLLYRLAMPPLTLHMRIYL